MKKPARLLTAVLIVIIIAASIALIQVFRLEYQHKLATEEAQNHAATSQEEKNKIEQSKQKAQEAARMATEALARKDAEREKHLKHLNTKLADEANAREMAEKSSADLKIRMRSLNEKLEATQTRYEELQKKLAEHNEQPSQVPATLAATEGYAKIAQKTPATKEQDNLVELIQQQRQEINELKKDHNNYETKRIKHLQEQIDLEERILSKGGEITIPSYRIWSPNYRPKRHRLESPAG